jgi:tetratricopeptide (TPR) repeat protein
VSEAESEYRAFVSARAKVPASTVLFNNTCADILGVAEKMLAGEIAYRKGDHESAYKILREAVQRDDALNYDEPWGWMQPARHALGALLLEQGHAMDAESVYMADLKRHPNNVWALHGLAEAFTLQGKSVEAEATRKQFSRAVVRADVKVDRSCYCRLDVSD